MKKTSRPAPIRHQFSVLRQICNLIPTHLVPKLARETGVEELCRTFSAWSHMASLLFAQLTGALGLNDVCDSLRLHSGPFSAVRGATPPSRNNLSYANKRRPASLAEKMFWSVLEHLQKQSPGFSKGRQGRRLAARFRTASHLAMSFDTCAAELKLGSPYPADSYHVMLTGSLRLLDLRKVAEPAFSGAYYSADRSISCQIVDANIGYLKSGGFDGILRYSKPLVDVDCFQDVVAITPDAIGKLGVKAIFPLGTISKPLNVILADGKVIPMVNYYPTA